MFLWCLSLLKSSLALFFPLSTCPFPPWELPSTCTIKASLKPTVLIASGSLEQEKQLEKSLGHGEEAAKIPRFPVSFTVLLFLFYILAVVSVEFTKLRVSILNNELEIENK